MSQLRQGHEAPDQPDQSGEAAGSVDDESLNPAALSLARRIASGGRVWCLAPGGVHHARDLAAEIVRPTSERPQAAVAVEDDTDPIAAARDLVGAGDVMVVVGDDADPVVAGLLRRNEAWGATTVLLATTARRPDTATADHVVWIGPDVDALAAAARRLAAGTEAVFADPGRLVDPDADCTEEVCITCSDEGRVVEVASLSDAHTAVVLAGGHEETVDISVVDEVGPGDLLLVHAGLALAIVEDPAERG